MKRYLLLSPRARSPGRAVRPKRDAPSYLPLKRGIVQGATAGRDLTKVRRRPIPQIPKAPAAAHQRKAAHRARPSASPAAPGRGRHRPQERTPAFFPSRQRGDRNTLAVESPGSSSRRSALPSVHAAGAREQGAGPKTTTGSPAAVQSAAKRVSGSPERRRTRVDRKDGGRPGSPKPAAASARARRPSDRQRERRSASRCRRTATNSAAPHRRPNA